MIVLINLLLIYKNYVNNINPELLVEYLSFSTALINLVQYTERANLCIATKKPADEKIALAVDALSRCITSLEHAKMSVTFYKEKIALLKGNKKIMIGGDSDNCYKCGQRAAQYEQEVMLATKIRISGTANTKY